MEILIRNSSHIRAVLVGAAAAMVTMAAAASPAAPLPVQTQVHALMYVYHWPEPSGLPLGLASNERSSRG